MGSASPARRAVLADLLAGSGATFSTAAADLDEKRLGAAARAANDARALVLELASAKGDALADAMDAAGDDTPALLITADQVVLGGGPPGSREIREKPADDAEAAAWIAGYATHPPATVSGLAVTAWPSRTRAVGVHEAMVVFVEEGVPAGADLDAAAAASAGCAGALKIEGPAARFIAEIRGGRDSVFGLPVQLLLELAARVDEEEAGRR
jgi:predicted house-cleaning NTP pyrophosphatase (Maf/HAM1 superfamily)